MIDHLYVIASVLLWGTSQFLLDKLLLTFSPVLCILLRFLFSGLLLIPFSLRKKRTPFHYRYLITGFLGAFGYYILSTLALEQSSVAFSSVMGGILPVLAILADRFAARRRATGWQLIGAAVSVAGILLFSFQADFSWNLSAALLMVLANLSWIFYGYFKAKWKIGEDSWVLCYEFLGTALLCGLLFPALKINAPVTLGTVPVLLAVVVLSTILPYRLYLKGARHMSLSLASMYMNLLPVTSLLPPLITGGLRLNPVQLLGIFALIFSAAAGNLGVPLTRGKRGKTVE